MVRPPPRPLTLSCRSGCDCTTCATALISPVEAQFARAPSSASAASFPHQSTAVPMLRSTSVPVLTRAEHAEFSASVRSMRGSTGGTGGSRRCSRPPLAGIFPEQEDVAMGEEVREVVSMPATPVPGREDREMQEARKEREERSYAYAYTFNCTPRTARTPRSPTSGQPRTASPSPSPSKRPASTSSRAAALRLQLRVGKEDT